MNSEMRDGVSVGRWPQTGANFFSRQNIAPLPEKELPYLRKKAPLQRTIKMAGTSPNVPLW
jgi:hypothetical protein